MNRALLLTAASVVAATSTGRGAGARDESQQSAPSLAAFAVSEVRIVRSAMPLGAWQAVHSSDSIELYRPNGRQETESEWCARAIGRVQLDSGRTARRVAYFYAPVPRPDAPLPASVSPAGLRSQCRLGMEWIVVLERDVVRAERLTSHTRESLTAALGAGDAVTELLWYGSAYWMEKVLWRSNGIEVVSATSAQVFDNPGDPRPGPPRTMVAIAGEPSAVSFAMPQYDPTCGTPSTPRCTEFLRIDEALSLASVGSNAEVAIRRQAGAFEHPKDPNARATPTERRAFVGDLKDWLQAARDLPASRKAAAFVAADLLLEASGYQMGVGDDEDSLAASMRVRLDSLGASFIHSPLGGVHLYRRSWMTEALNAGGGGRAFDLAFLTMMERGFETGICSTGMDGFRTVISRGEKFLRDFPNSTIAHDVHLLMARAHGDVVALASGAAYEAADTTSYATEAPAARNRAIAEYTAVLAYAGVPSDVRRDAWSSAWRLLAGLSPLETHFYCVYD